MIRSIFLGLLYTMALFGVQSSHVAVTFLYDEVSHICHLYRNGAKMGVYPSAGKQGWADCSGEVPMTCAKWKKYAINGMVSMVDPIEGRLYFYFQSLSPGKSGLIVHMQNCRY